MAKEFIWLLGIFVTVILLFGAVVLWIGRSEAQKEEVLWNNGYCNCGGKWVFNNGSHDRFTEYYWFKCVKCNNVAVFRGVNPATK